MKPMKLTWKEVYNIATIAKETCKESGEEWERETIVPICDKLIRAATKEYDNFEIKGLKNTL